MIITCTQCLGLRVVPFYSSGGEVLRPAAEANEGDETIRVGRDLMVRVPGKLAPVRGTCGSMVRCPKCKGRGTIEGPAK